MKPGSIEADLDPPWPHLVPQGFGGPFEREFRGAVGGHGGHRHHAADRRNVEDPAAPFFAHARQHQLDQLHRTVEIDHHLLEQGVVRKVLDHRPVGHPGVVDQNVDPAPAVAGLLDHPVALFGARHVERAQMDPLRFGDAGGRETVERVAARGQDQPVGRDPRGGGPERQAQTGAGAGQKQNVAAVPGVWHPEILAGFPYWVCGRLARIFALKSGRDARAPVFKARSAAFTSSHRASSAAMTECAEIEAALVAERFDPGEAAAELEIPRGERQFGIDLEVAGEVDHREEQVAHLGGQRFLASRTAFAAEPSRFDLAQLLVHLGQHAAARSGQSKPTPAAFWPSR